MFQFFLPVSVLSLFCSELEIGSDILKLGNIVSSGKVQNGWKYSDVNNEVPASESILFFYLKGLDSLGPKFEIASFHHEDEVLSPESQWLSMSVSLDEEINGIFKDYRAIKVIQQCKDQEGFASIISNVTFKAHSCEAVTVNWIKLCGEPSQLRVGLNIGFSSDSFEVVHDGEVTSLFDSDLENEVFTVPSHQNEMALYMNFQGEATRTYFKSPYLVTDHEVLFPSLSGNIMKTTWIEESFLELKIEFNCLLLSGVHEEIELVVEIPYFKDLQVFFYKDCGIQKVNSKVLGIVVLAAGLGILILVMWMHVNGSDWKFKEIWDNGSTYAKNGYFKVSVFLALKYRSALKKGFKDENCIDYGTV
jgi:hypothetical protein